jgi:hypothetical protein
MSIDPNEARSDEWVLSRYDAELDADSGIAAATEAIDQVLPIVPSGGRTEELVKPQVVRALSLRDRVRIWSPAIAGTAGVGVLVVDPGNLPLTGPLIGYGLAWAGFGWWTAAGRPGLADSVRMVAYAVTDHYARLRAWVTRVSERRGVYEARRTAVEGAKP